MSSQVRAIVTFKGNTGVGAVSAVMGAQTIKAGDPILAVIDLTAQSDSTQNFFVENPPGAFSGEQLSGPTLNGYIFQNSTTDFSGRFFMAVIGIGPAG